MKLTSVELLEIIEDIKKNCGPLIFIQLDKFSIEQILPSIKIWKEKKLCAGDFCGNCFINSRNCANIINISKTLDHTFDNILKYKEYMDQITK